MSHTNSKYWGYKIPLLLELISRAALYNRLPAVMEIFQIYAVQYGSY